MYLCNSADKYHFNQVLKFNITNSGIMTLFASFFFNFYLFIYLFIYSWLCWVFVSAWRLSPVVASGGHSSSRWAGLLLSWPLLLRSTGSRRAGSVVVAHWPSCSVACGIFPDQGSNPCPLHWQADSQPLRHQGSPCLPLDLTWEVHNIPYVVFFLKMFNLSLILRK